MSIEGEGSRSMPTSGKADAGGCFTVADGPSQPVDEESTRQCRMPMEDGSEMPFFLTRGVKSIVSSSGRFGR